ncbi:hypothetical protein L195_g034090, partial [Trifolium pratense]
VSMNDLKNYYPIRSHSLVHPQHTDNGFVFAAANTCPRSFLITTPNPEIPSLVIVASQFALSQPSPGLFYFDV